MQDRLRVGEELEAERAYNQTGGEVAENRTEPEPLEQRHGDDSSPKQHDYT